LIEQLIRIFRESFAELRILFYDHRYVGAVLIDVVVDGIQDHCKMGFYGLVGHACRFAGRVLQLIEEIAGLLDTCFVVSLKLLTKHLLVRPK
jgi:hypothetical protein